MSDIDTKAWTDHPEARIVVATGWCAICDARFKDALVVAIPDSAVPGGIVRAEVRHFADPAVRADTSISASAKERRGDLTTKSRDTARSAPVERAHFVTRDAC